MITHPVKYLFITQLIVSLSLSGPISYAENIDPQNTDDRYAYSENAGWLNLQPSGQGGSGVEVNDSGLSGYMWGENTGWIRLSHLYGNVSNDSFGGLSGYAWGENIGWINFDPVGGGVYIDACGDFNGKAWGENIGWISFRSNAEIPFKVTTQWVSPVDEVAPETVLTKSLPEWLSSDANISLLSSDCGSGTRDVRYMINDGNEVIVEENTVNFVISGDGIYTLFFYSVDNDGNIESQQEQIIRIDKTPPAITLNTPADEMQYFINTSVMADYSVTDFLSGISIQQATTPSGEAINTSITGINLFSVSATDVAGNSSRLTHSYIIIYPGNIDPDSDGSQYAFAENTGWLNFKPSYGPAVTVSETALVGFIWSENIGWINLSPVHGGVSNSANGDLSGYAWGENIGWINFAPTYGGVMIDSGGNFYGWAWGENIGWISLQDINSPYMVKTSWTAQQVLLGDLDANGCVDRLDLYQLLVEIRNTSNNDLTNDLNGDALLNIADVRFLVTLFSNPLGTACQ